MSELSVGKAQVPAPQVQRIIRSFLPHSMFEKVQVDDLTQLGDPKLLAWAYRAPVKCPSLRTHFKNSLGRPDTGRSSIRKSEVAQVARMLRAFLSAELPLPVDMLGYLLSDLGLSLCLNVDIARILVDSESLHPTEM